MFEVSEDGTIVEFIHAEEILLADLTKVRFEVWMNPFEAKMVTKVLVQESLCLHPSNFAEGEDNGEKE